MPYNLSSSQADRINFDQMVKRYADECLNSLTKDEIIQQMPHEYAAAIWEDFQSHLREQGDIDDTEAERCEAKARFFAIFPQAVREWQDEIWQDQLAQELYRKDTGHTTAITALPGGQKDGLDYNATVVEIVVLDIDGDTIAYRASSDAQDEDWQLGTIKDAVKCAIDYRDAIEDAESHD